MKLSSVKHKNYFPIAIAYFFLNAASSQSLPSAGDILRESRSAAQPVAVEPAPALPTAGASQPSLVTGPTLRVQRFEVEGNSVVDAHTLNAQLADLVGQELGLAQLQAAADRLTLYYRSRGFHAVALLPEQSLQDGVLRIVVVEAKLGQLRVEKVQGSAPVPLGLAQAMIAHGQQPGQLLLLGQLDQANLLLSDVPGIKSDTSLQQGAESGQTDVYTVVSALPVWAGNASLDANDARTTGRAKASLALAASNALGWGEQSTLALQKTEGKTFALLGYSHPVHASGTRASMSMGQLKYRLVNGSQAEGDANTWSLSISQPWIRSEGYNLSSTLAYNASDSNTRSATDSRSQVGTSTLGLNGNWLDALGGSSFNSWGLQWATGKEDKTELATHTSHAFRKWVYNALRMQRVSPLGTLSLSVNGQWAGSSLPSSETFSLGGASAVRAYPAFEGNGDRGWVGVLEYRHDLSAGHVLKAFYDHGRIHRLAAASGPAQYALKGVGLGWDATVNKTMLIKSAVAWRLGNNPNPLPNKNDFDGSLRRPQLWLNAVHTF
jgi:hemolysin activation/secretion protein